MRKICFPSLAANEAERCQTVLSSCHFSSLDSLFRTTTANCVFLEAFSSLHKGFIIGNITTSLRFSSCISIANILSIPIPKPDCGGNQCSIARR